MFEQYFKKCEHEYKQVGYISATVENDGVSLGVPCYFLECKKCGKKRVLRESDFNYKDSFLEMMNLWEKGQFKINFKEFQDDKEDKISYLKEELNTKYCQALESLGDELQKLKFEMSDSENRLIVNNMKEIIKKVLTEDLSEKTE